MKCVLVNSSYVGGIYKLSKSSNPNEFGKVVDITKKEFDEIQKAHQAYYIYQTKLRKIYQSLERK